VFETLGARLNSEQSVADQQIWEAPAAAQPREDVQPSRTPQKNLRRGDYLTKVR